MKKGFSLIETLVVVTLFAVVGIIVSQSTAVSLMGSRKSDASIKTRESISQAVSVIERQLRSAKSVSSACDGVTQLSTINYYDQNGIPSNFSCVSGANSFVASGSAQTRLTSPETTRITRCQFICTRPASNLPPTINFIVEAQSRDSTGIEGSTVTLETGITLRAY